MNDTEEPIEPEDSFTFEEDGADLPSAHSVALPVAAEDVDSFSLDAAFDESPEVYGEALAAKIEFARAQEFRENELLVAESSHQSVLVFRLGNRLLGIDVLEITEVFQVESLMPVPNTPRGLLGIANQRGNVLCVIDLEMVLEDGQGVIPRRPESTAATLVLRDTSLRVGFPIDSVLGISPIRGTGYLPSREREGFLGTLELDSQEPSVVCELIDFKYLERALRNVSFTVGAA